MRKLGIAPGAAAIVVALLQRKPFAGCRGATASPEPGVPPDKHS